MHIQTSKGLQRGTGNHILFCKCERLREPLFGSFHLHVKESGNVDFLIYLSIVGRKTRTVGLSFRQIVIIPDGLFSFPEISFFLSSGGK